ncbi:hypothetical protein LWI28_011263 [Acer negundo]|uniref:DUF4283 domain-containing protein n=1 Tax=Acer negundo TaxID=4023 RepID=A0AAD5IEK8_ACENE|nr:hypothetical protein LWI28_011263 [Acer negundo]
MHEWKESWLTLTKLKWLEVYGVPPTCWCKAFFKKISGLVGETMWVDEETLNKTRLDIGRILILAPLDKIIPSEVLVKTGQRAFPIRVEESTLPVSSEWLSNTLGLNHGLKFRAGGEVDSGDFHRASGKGEWGLVEKYQCKADRAAERAAERKEVYVNVKEKGEKRDFRVGLKSRIVEKGKGRKISKLKSKPPQFPANKGGIRIGVGRVGQRCHNSSMDPSSSEDESAETTTQVEKVITSQGRSSNQGINLCIDLRSQDSGNKSIFKGGSISPTKEIQSQDTVVTETQLEGSGKNQVEGIRKVKGRGSLYTRSHPMKTRCNNLTFKSGLRKVKWNLEDEIAKAIEKGMAM